MGRSPARSIVVLATLRRRRRKWLKPEDMTKEAVGKTFKKVCAKLGQGPNLEKARQGVRNVV